MYFLNGIHKESCSRPVQETKHRYKQSDNINYFLNFVRNVGMPEVCLYLLVQKGIN